MNEIEKFVYLFLKRFFKPVNLIWQKIYCLLPIAIKNNLNSSNLKITILMILILVLSINYLEAKNIIVKHQLQAAYWPLSIKNHLNLAEDFFNNSDLNQAKLEINKAENLYYFYKIFDFKQNSFKQINKAQEIINQPEKINQEINYWQKMLLIKPDFKDIYLRLSLLNYQIWQDDEAEKYWQNAFYLDPNNSTVKQMENLLKNN